MNDHRATALCRIKTCGNRFGPILLPLALIGCASSALDPSTFSEKVPAQSVEQGKKGDSQRPNDALAPRPIASSAEKAMSEQVHPDAPLHESQHAMISPSTEDPFSHALSEALTTSEGAVSLPPSPSRISPNQESALVSLLTTLKELLLLAPDVARIQWNARQEPQDETAQELMLNRVIAKAHELDADPELFHDFFMAQLQASQYVQSALQQQWKDAKLPFVTLTRTPAQVQAASDEITPQLFRALAAAAPALRSEGAKAVIQFWATEIMPDRSALSEPTRTLAIQPLLDRAAE